MADQQIKSKIENYLTDVIEARRPEFSDMPVCPFAKSERLSGRLLIGVFDPATVEFKDLVSDMERQGYDSGLFAVYQGDTPVEIAASDTKKMQTFLNKTLRIAGMKRYKTICFNPNDELANEKYHIEDLAIWKQEISLMHSMTKLYYYYDLAGHDLTKNAGLKGLEALFIKKNGKQYYFDDSYKSMIKDIKEINVSIDGIDKFEKNKNINKISYEQLIVKLLISILKPRLENSTNRNLKEIQLQKKYQPRDYVWFNFEKDYTSLYSFIWAQFGNFIQDRGTFKICEKCKKYFVSKVVQRGRFCSDKCRASIALYLSFPKRDIERS